MKTIILLFFASFLIISPVLAQEVVKKDSNLSNAGLALSVVLASAQCQGGLKFLTYFITNTMNINLYLKQDVSDLKNIILNLKTSINDLETDLPKYKKIVNDVGIRSASYWSQLEVATFNRSYDELFLWSKQMFDQDSTDVFIKALFETAEKCIDIVEDLKMKVIIP